MTSTSHNFYKTTAIQYHYAVARFRFMKIFRPHVLWYKFKKSAYQLFKIRITSAGRNVILCMMFLVVLNLSPGIFPVFSLLLFIIYLSLSLSILFRPRLKVTCSFPDRVTVGKEMEISVRVENRSKIPAFEIFVGLLPLPKEFRVISFDIVSCLKAGKTAEIRLKLLPLQRGIYRLPAPSCYSLFPFHLFRSGQICRGKRTLVVQPEYYHIGDLDVPMIKSYQGSCNKLNSQTGDSLEYIGNREYRYGDSLKNIDMRAWARTNRPVVREFGQEYYSNVGVILDNYVASEKNADKSSSECLEAAISVTASIIERLCHDEHLITFFAADKRCWNFHSIRNITVLNKVLEELAIIDETNDNDLDGLIASILEHINKLSVIIFILNHLDDRRIAIIESIRQMGCDVKTIVVTEKTYAHPSSQVGRDVNFISPRQITNGSLNRL